MKKIFFLFLFLFLLSIKVSAKDLYIPEIMDYCPSGGFDEGVREDFNKQKNICSKIPDEAKLSKANCVLELWYLADSCLSYSNARKTQAEEWINGTREKYFAEQQPISQPISQPATPPPDLTGIKNLMELLLLFK